MRFKKPFFIFFIFVFTLAAIIAFATLYFYHHPSSAKSLIEIAISKKTGFTLTIEDISYSLDPLCLRAKNIAITDGKTMRGIDLNIPLLAADFNLSGAFGHKKLIVQYLKIASFSLHLDSDLKLPETITGARPPSAFNRLLQQIAGFFFFRELKIRSADIVNGKIEYQSADQQFLLQQINAELDMNQADISGSAEINWPESGVAFSFPSFKVMAIRGFSHEKLKISGRVLVPDAAFISPKARAEGIKIQLRLFFNSLLRQIVFDEAVLACQRLSLPGKTDPTILTDPLHLNVKGIYKLAENKLILSNWCLAVKNLLELTGKADIELASPYSAQIKLSEGQLISQRLISTYMDFVDMKTLPLSLSGSVGLIGDIEVNKVKSNWVYQSDLALRLKRNRVSFGSNHGYLEGWVTGNLRAKGQLPRPQLTAKLLGEDITLKDKKAVLKPFKVDIAVTGQYPVFSITDLSARIPGISIAVGKKDYRVDEIIIRLKKGNFNLQNGSFSWPEILLSTSVLENLRMSVNGQKQQMLLKLEGKNSRLLEAAKSVNLLPANWQFSALDSLHIMAVIRPGNWSTFSSKLELADINFSNPNEDCMGENVRAVAEISALYHLEEGKMKAALSLTSTKGELLCDKYYFDLAKNNLSVSGNGAYNAPLHNLQLSDLKIGFQHLLALDLSGNLFYKSGKPQFDLSIKIPKTDINPVFHHLVSEPFKYEKPALAASQVGGLISTRLNLAFSQSGWTLKGKSFWHEGKMISDATGISLKGIDVDLPLWYQSGRPKTGFETLKGSLSIQEMTLPYLPTQPVLFPFKVTPDSIAVADSTRLRFQNGEILFGPILFNNIFDSRLSVKTSLTLNAVRVDPLLEGIWPNPTRGLIQGQLDEMIFDGSDITSRGQLTIDIFDGQIIVYDPGISSVFSSAPAIKLGAQISDLNLAKLTEGTSFGKIKGVLGGYIKNLEIVNRQPQKFDLRLETVPKKNVPQKINVKAVENIARIGGGNSPFSGLAGTFVSFFEDFSYQKVGMIASLENDVFKINGTVKEAGVEYLVKKGGLAGVDVVNTNPDNRISFKDMVKRIKRIKGTKGEPIVR